MPAPWYPAALTSSADTFLRWVRLFFGQDGGGGFFDDLLVATLNRAVANARSPDIAVVVGDDLYLDVACIGDKAFEEDDGVAEGPLCFALRALECNFEFVLRPRPCGYRVRRRRFGP